MKLAQLLNPGLHSGLAKIQAATVPAKTAFKLKGIANQVKTELEKFEEVRKELVQKYGEKNEAGELKIDAQGNANLEGPAREEFQSQVVDLGNMEITIPTLSVSELGNVELNTNEMIALDGIIVE